MTSFAFSEKIRSHKPDMPVVISPATPASPGLSGLLMQYRIYYEQLTIPGCGEFQYRNPGPAGMLSKIIIWPASFRLSLTPNHLIISYPKVIGIFSNKLINGFDFLDDS
jgi:hypothetical protein